MTRTIRNAYICLVCALNQIERKTIIRYSCTRSSQKWKGCSLVLHRGYWINFVGSSDFSDAIILSKAANILRKHMLAHEWKFDGRFHVDSVENSIPPTPQQFVCLVEHGVGIKSQIEFGSSKTDLAVAQLLQYNCYTHKANISTFRHSKNRETPFPIFMGLSLYGENSKTRSCGIVTWTWSQHSVRQGASNICSIRRCCCC